MQFASLIGVTTDKGKHTNVARRSNTSPVSGVGVWVHVDRAKQRCAAGACRLFGALW